MSRYIDADALTWLVEEYKLAISPITEEQERDNRLPLQMLTEFENMITEQPTVDAIKRLTDEVDRKDKAIQAFLKQIEQMIAERKKLRDTLIESICVNCDTPPDVRLRVCGECPIISPIREVFDE